MKVGGSMKKFLVVVDTQFDFMMPKGALYVQGAEEIIVPGINFLANLNPDEYAGVLFTYDTHTPEIYEGSPESQQFPIHCVKGTPGWENVFNPKLVNQDIATFTLEKGVFNMWEEENIKIEDEDGDLAEREYFFEHLKNHADTVVVIGVAADFCVKWAIDGFVQRGWNVEVIHSLTMGIVDQMPEVLNAPEYTSVKLV
jgi:nicotinamidase/pyrazinamidase